MHRAWVPIAIATTTSAAVTTSDSANTAITAISTSACTASTSTLASIVSAYGAFASEGRPCALGAGRERRVARRSQVERRRVHGKPRRRVPCAASRRVRRALDRACRADHGHAGGEGDSLPRKQCYRCVWGRDVHWPRLRDLSATVPAYDLRTDSAICASSAGRVASTLAASSAVTAAQAAATSPVFPA